MKIIVGLGNPGKQYEKTRHNAGFLVLDRVADKLGIEIKEKKFKALLGQTFINGEKVILVKPQTFMNLSGESVQQILKYYQEEAASLLIISDDLDLTVGSLRLRESGSSGGQKGIQNIMDCLGTQEFLRLRVGIGNNKNIETVDYVLGKIDDEVALDEAAACVLAFLSGTALLELKNMYNKKVKL